MKRKHVIQAMITTYQGTQKCSQCKKSASLLYTSYEVISKQDLDRYNRELAKCTSDSEALQVANSSMINDVIYQATLQEQLQGRPQVHIRSYECLACESDFIDLCMNIPHVGRIVLSRLAPIGAVWIIRDRAFPDRVGIYETPHQDVTHLQEELYNSITLQMTRLTY